MATSANRNINVEGMTGLLSIAEEVKALIRDEWDKQGHDLTGAFKKQLTHEIVETADRINIRIIDGTDKGYGKIINVGVPAASIKSRYAPGRIAGLTNYAKLRMGADDKEAKSIAYAIATKHSQQGMPLPSSNRFSQTGKRIEFVQAIEPATTKIVRRYMFELIKLKAATRDN